MPREALNSRVRGKRKLRRAHGPVYKLGSRDSQFIYNNSAAMNREENIMCAV